MRSTLATIPTFYMSTDPGNRTTVGARRDADGKNEVVKIFPSFVYEVNLQDHLRHKEGTSKSNDETDNILTYNGKSFYYGERAMQQGTLADDARGAGGRYWSLHNFILILGMIVELLQEPKNSLENLGAFDPQSNTYEAEVKLGTGMPVSVYSPQRADLVRTTFSGVHKFSCNGKNYILHLSIGPVIMEGVGGLLLYGGTSTKRRFCIDGGYWSTEFVTMQGPEFIEENSGGFPIGIGLAFDAIKKSVATTFGRELDEDEAQALLLAQARHEELPIISLYDKPLPPKELSVHTKNALDSYGIPMQQRLVSKLSSAAGLVATNIEPALYIGGAAYYAMHFAQAKIPNIRTVPDPEKVNARTYCLMATRYKQWEKIPVVEGSIVE